MSQELALARTLAATVAVLWIACIVVGLLPPERSRFPPGFQLRPRTAVYGAVAVAVLYLLLAVLQGRLWLRFTSSPPDGRSWAEWLEGPSRTTSSGATFVAIAVLLSALAAWIGERSRVAARGAMLFALVLLAGATWPVLSIPRWCAYLGAPPDLPEPSPIVAYRPDCDPAGWLDRWSRDLMPLAPSGMVLALLGIGAGLVLLRRATTQGDAKGRESACAGIACCGLIVVSLATLELEKYAAWESHDKHVGFVRSLQLANDEFDRLVGRHRRWVWNYPVEPGISRPVASGLLVVSSALGLGAALFGEFHLRGRRVLREPEPAAATDSA